jgi:hypothetical protein
MEEPFAVDSCSYAMGATIAAIEARERTRQA